MPFQIQSLALLLPALALAAPTQLLKPRQGWGSVTSATGLSFYNANLASGTSGKADASEYTCYSGPASNFPAVDTWISFEAMWALISADALAPIGDTAEQIADLYTAITDISVVSQVDARVILATIIDESTGNVNVGCTNNGVENCGLMQSHAPADTSFVEGDAFYSIAQMVQDGTQGTAAGPGLVQLLNDEALTNGNVWNAFRAYNSGSVDEENLSDPVGATAAYVSNMANYLTGWNGWGAGPTPCIFY